MGGCCSTHSTKRASAAAPRPGATTDAGADTSISFVHQTRFAYHLATALFSPSAPVATTNAVISPLSLYVVLSLLAAGAGGGTRDQLVATLGDGEEGVVDDLHALAEKIMKIVLADKSRAGGPRIAFANGIFVDSALKVKSAFNKVAAGKYKTETWSIDFQNKAAQAAGEVNSWVEKVTSGLVKELLPPGSVDQTTGLVLGNALYFKGSWAQKFDAFIDTKDGEFHLLDGSSVQTPFMTSAKDQYISSYDNVKVLRLPYQQGRDKRQFSMYILLPEKQDGIWTLAENLSSEPEFLDRRMPKWKFPVRQFKVPKFKVSFGFEASDLLNGLGIQLPFSAEADLSELVDSPFKQNVRVSSIFHKSFVEVNEEGTEAAAASAVEVMVCGTPMPVDFIADHPFMFLIREDTTGVVLFVGLVANPLLAP